ncbi:MAG: 50S ribosomal protein L35 [Candidatus Eiseniibacteriota bacterium]|nr:MAG: 50S ribosomal protein L35 [Candidatus Eisenbacteria bacterium]
MPKQKSTRGAKKRFRVTGSGKIMRRRACAGHKLTKKSRKQKRRLSKPTVVSKRDRGRIRRMIQA